jgi:hypothetical protein
MGKNLSRERQIWKLLLLIHLICYEIFFIYTVDGFKFGSSSYVHQYVIALLFWTPILLLHVGATYYQIGRGDISALEREAYRDGFADAVRQLGNRPDALERLTLADEDELLELPEKRKRS